MVSYFALILLWTNQLESAKIISAVKLNAI